MSTTDTALGEALDRVRAATTPEELIAAPMAVMQAHLGDREAHLVPGALAPGQEQFLVGGGFLLTPDQRHLMLTGSTGFPPEQRRLCVPADGGDPGRVIATGQPLLLADTRSHAGFRQYLRTARMGSAAYAPLLRDGTAFGLIITAGLAANTMGEADLATLTALAAAIAARWEALGGPVWLAAEHARAVGSGEAFIVSREGVTG